MGNCFINKLSKSLNLSDFVRKNNTWVREHNTFFYVFNIQASKYKNENQEEDFAINMGVFIPAVNKLCWEKDVSLKNIKETDCCLRGRLSLFFNTNTDWFTINNEAEIEKTGDEINDLINASIMPFFQRIDSLDDIYNEMIKIENKVIQKELHQIYIACIESVMYKKADALIRLSKIENVVWANKAKEIAQRLSDTECS